MGLELGLETRFQDSFWDGMEGALTPLLRQPRKVVYMSLIILATYLLVLTSYQHEAGAWGTGAPERSLPDRTKGKHTPSSDVSDVPPWISITDQHRGRAASHPWSKSGTLKAPPSLETESQEIPGSDKRAAAQRRAKLSSGGEARGIGTSPGPGDLVGRSRRHEKDEGEVTPSPDAGTDKKDALLAVMEWDNSREKGPVPAAVGNQGRGPKPVAAGRLRGGPGRPSAGAADQAGKADGNEMDITRDQAREQGRSVSQAKGKAGQESQGRGKASLAELKAADGGGSMLGTVGDGGRPLRVNVSGTMCPPLEVKAAGAQAQSGPTHWHYPTPSSYDRGECTCMPVSKFVILSMQRSGSGWFETLLNSHPNISSHGEIFSRAARRGSATAIRQELSWTFNLERAGNKSNCTAAVGLKWMMNQGLLQFREDVVDYFREQHVGVVLLLRRNALRRLISVLANLYDSKKMLLGGRHKSHVHSRDEASKLARFRPSLNIGQLPDLLGRMQRVADEAKTAFAGIRMLTLYYEDVMKDPDVSWPPQNGPRRQFRTKVTARSTQSTEGSACLRLGRAESQWECNPGSGRRSAIVAEHGNGWGSHVQVDGGGLRSEVLTKVQEFLGVPPRRLESRQVKIHSSALRKHISNWEEVKQALRGTAFESHLYD